MTDALTEWMSTLRTHGVIVARNRLPSRWGVTMAARPATAFHYLPRGRAFLRMAGQPVLELHEGDFVLVTRGDAHAIVSDVDYQAIPLAEVIAGPPPFTGEHCTTLVCGEYSDDIRLDDAPWHALPALAHFTHAELEADDALRSTLGLLRAEVERPMVGGDALARHLLDALFVYLLRAWGRSARCEGTLLAGLQDAALAKALRRMHEQPAGEWTVEALAAEARLSRAAFARRFTEAFGESPMGYLTRWRMTLATRFLTDGALSVAEIADRVGYRSEFAFSRAFKRLKGAAPSLYRRGLA